MSSILKRFLIVASLLGILCFCTGCNDSSISKVMSAIDGVTSNVVDHFITTMITVATSTEEAPSTSVTTTERQPLVTSEDNSVNNSEQSQNTGVFISSLDEYGEIVVGNWCGSGKYNDKETRGFTINYVWDMYEIQEEVYVFEDGSGKASITPYLIIKNGMSLEEFAETYCKLPSDDLDKYFDEGLDKYYITGEAMPTSISEFVILDWSSPDNAKASAENMADLYEMTAGLQGLQGLE